MRDKQFSPCYFCSKPVSLKDAEFMFQGQPVCVGCQIARRYVASLCTPTRQYLGIDPAWRSQVNPTKKNTSGKRP